MKQRVGLGKANLSADVRLVQALLNCCGRMPRRQPMASGLVTDGRFGPRTLNAIKAYQADRFGASDGVISPGRPTIRALAYESRIATSFFGLNNSISMPVRSTLIRDIPNPIDQIPLLPPPLIATNEDEERANAAFTLLPRTLAVAAKAVRIVDQARDLLRLKRDTPENRQALSLVAKHFTERKESADPLNVYIDFIYGIFVLAQNNLATRIAQAPMRGFFVGSKALQGPNAAAAMYWASAWTILPGVPVGGWVTLYPLWSQLSDQLKISIVIHELAHGFGFKENQPNSVNDYAYPHEPRYAPLPMGRRVYTAACYGTFAHDAAFGSPSMVRDYGHVEKFERSPFVSNAGTITDP
ncbi:MULTISPECIES: peptidoglycan-binding domain-containing protein [Roseomonadaceae]|uniref:Peptidoglycan-binding protein n=1 Tax=Falsiroseomonas oleicola TaxID=2801474 RepID=A0ABS6H6U7_9PROT|nr:peptidoglycan-binding domain-containing protein [Roseomonas oleicola]MBU8544410.1 peptidoglycan-binding protein [Roseomonas oleicola]